MRPLPYTKNYGQLRKPEHERVFLKEEHSNELIINCQTVSLEKNTEIILDGMSNI